MALNRNGSSAYYIVPLEVLTTAVHPALPADHHRGNYEL